MGAGTGVVIGALSRNDVWAPAAIARRKPELLPPNPPVAAAPVWWASEYLSTLGSVETLPFARFRRE